MKTVIFLVMLFTLLPVSAYALELGDVLSPDGPYMLALLALIEYVLGKTDWVKANSVVELVLNFVLKAFKKEQPL